MILDIKPKMGKIVDSKAVYQTSTITYNEAGITYNEAGVLYGGGDSVSEAGPRIQNIYIEKIRNDIILGVKPNNDIIIDIKPRMSKIIDL